MLKKHLQFLRGGGLLSYDQSLEIAKGAIVGNYLTTAGNNLKQDIEMFTALGFDMNTPRKSG